MKRTLLLCLSLFSLFSPGASPAGQAESQPWQPTPGPTGGSVAALALSPNYAVDHTVFAGLRSQGIYRTANGGDSWQPVGPGGWVVVDLALSPAFADDQTLFATHGLWTAGYHVHRSTEEGDSWQDITPAWTSLPSAPSLAISPDFAADETLYVVGGSQVFTSTDGGDTFIQASGWFTSHNVSRLAFSPAYATDQTLFALVPGDGLYKSTNGATDWTLTTLTGSYSTFSVSPDYASDQMLLAVGATDGQLHISTNGGDSWSPGTLTLDAAGQHTLLFSPTFAADRIILAASSTDPGAYRSEDGGATWSPVGWYDPDHAYKGGFIGGGVSALALAPSGSWDAAAFAGTNSGLYRSYDWGVHWWQSNESLAQLTVRALAIAPGAPDTMLVGTSFFEHLRFDTSTPGEYDGNLQLSTDGGQTWRDVSGQLDRVNNVAFSPNFANDATAFAATGTLGQHGYFDGGVYRSTNGGQDWQKVFGDHICRALAISPNFAADQTVWTSASTYSSALGLYVSGDGGDTWGPLAPSIHAHSLAPSPNYALDQTLFAATHNGLERSTDSGLSWTQVFSQPITALAVSPAYGASRTLYVAIRDDLVAPDEIYRSTDGGDTWQHVDTGIPSTIGADTLVVSSLSFAYDGSVLAGVYYGGESGHGAVYRSTDGGNTWQAAGSGLDEYNILTLTTLPSGSMTFYSGTDTHWGRSSGLWQIYVPQGGRAEPGIWTSNGPRGGRATALAVSPNFAFDGVAFTGTGTMGRFGNAWGLGIFRSNDEGRTWQPSPLDPESISSASAIYDYAFSPAFATDQTAFVGTWGGLFETNDGGASWQSVPGAFLGPPGSITTVEIAPDFPASGHMMGGSPWGGLYVSSDGGHEWTVDYSFGSVSEIAYSPAFATDKTAFVMGYPGGDAHLMRTIDGAISWTPVLSKGICSLAISPEFESDGTIFAGSDALYISHDWGTTWISVTVPAKAPAVCPLAISPAFGTDQTLFTATAEGLYRSNDGGISWNHVPGYSGPPIRTLAISPGWPDHPVLLIGGANGVYRSADGGDSWILSPGMVTLSIEPLALSANSRHLIAGAYQYGIYGSDNAGETWSPLGLQEAETSRIADIALSPGYPADSTLFAALGNTQSIGTSIHRTTDGGATWERVHSGGSIYQKVLAISSQYSADRTIYAALDGLIWGSDDGGENWNLVGDWPPNTWNVARMVALPPNYATDGSIFAAGDGVWRLATGATTWELAASGLVTGTSVSTMTVSPNYALDATLLAAASWQETPGGEDHHGVFRSTDGGVHWALSSIGLPNLSGESIAFSPNYASDHTAYLTVDEQLYRSLDGGQRWTAVGTAPGASMLRNVVADSQGNVYVAAGGEYASVGFGVWRYSTSAQDIIVNGGFEVDTGWDLPSQRAGYSDGPAFDGARSMRVGIVNGANQHAYSSARQSVAIPADALTATLRFHLYPVSGESAQIAQAQAFPQGMAEDVVSSVNSPQAGDAQYMLLLEPEQETLLWQLANTQSWQVYEFDLSEYAGETVKLHFGVFNDGAGGRTGMYVDNVSLVVQRPRPEGMTYWQYLPLIFR